jgi:Zn-dependent alcohol dehydrogenase|tara:strand:+ start:570 stop:1676 length:1107 start_codon:yes stop_codon:yes gene_type:complete
MFKTKAAVLYEANKPLQIETLNQEEPRNGEVRVRTSVAGICASDHHYMKGDNKMPMPVVLGHEGSGYVESVGPGVQNFKPGDRVITAFISGCGNCTYCQNGFVNLCTTSNALNTKQYDGTLRLKKEEKSIHQMQKLGLFSEYLICPQQSLYLLPDEVPMDVAALIGCAVSTGVGSILNQIESKPGIDVVIFGLGGVGLSALMGAKILNCNNIIAVDIKDHKLEFATKFGATHTINSSETDPVKEIMSITGNNGVDMSFDTFGRGSVTNQAIQSTKRKGTTVIVGIAPIGDTVNADMVDLCRNQKTLIGSFYGSISPHESFRQIIKHYLKGEIDIRGLVERTYKLEQINEAFNDLENGQDGRGIIIYPN